MERRERARGAGARACARPTLKCEPGVRLGEERDQRTVVEGRGAGAGDILSADATVAAPDRGGGAAGRAPARLGGPERGRLHLHHGRGRAARHHEPGGPAPPRLPGAQARPHRLPGSPRPRGAGQGGQGHSARGRNGAGMERPSDRAHGQGPDLPRLSIGALYLRRRRANHRPSAIRRGAGLLGQACGRQGRRSLGLHRRQRRLRHLPPLRCDFMGLLGGIGRRASGRQMGARQRDRYLRCRAAVRRHPDLRGRSGRGHGWQPLGLYRQSRPYRGEAGLCGCLVEPHARTAGGQGGGTLGLHRQARCDGDQADVRQRLRIRRRSGRRPGRRSVGLCRPDGHVRHQATVRKRLWVPCWAGSRADERPLGPY